MVPQSTNIVESPTFVMRSIWVYLMIEHNVVKRPRIKMDIKPSFFPSLISNLIRTGSGRSATTMSDTMVMTA